MFNAFKDWRLSSAVALLALTLLFIFAGGTKGRAQDADHSHYGQHLIQQMDDSKQLGDDGYKHNWLHKHYQEYFSQLRCPCHQGECAGRPRGVETLKTLASSR
jgi:hypothetical protein